MSLRERGADLVRAARKDDVRALSRRYFVANGFDGVLTSIGIVVGAYLSGVTEGRLIVMIGLGAAVGLGTSGVWSVWEIERAEQRRAQNELEMAMLTDVEDTLVAREFRAAQVLHASASASGPVLGIAITLFPLLLEGTVLTLGQSVLAAIGVGVIALGSVGAYLASISRQRWYVSAIRMGLAGIVVAALNVLLPGSGP